MEQKLAYILGTIKGDGCAYHYHNNGKNMYMVFLVAKKKSYLEHVASQLLDYKKNYSIYPHLNCYTLRFYSKWMFGLIKNTPYKEILQDKECYTSFLRGFYEAEGYVYSKKRKDRGIHSQLGICNHNYELLSFVEKILKRLKFKYTFSIYKYTYKGITGLACKLLINKREDILRFLELINPKIKTLKPEHFDTMKESLDKYRKRTPKELKQKKTYYNKKWYAKSGKNYYQKNIGWIREKARKWYHKNHEKVLRMKRKNYQKHKDKRRKWALDYYYNHREEINKKRRERRKIIKDEKKFKEIQ